MGQLLIRNLDESTKQRLRERAARHGRSMEAEVRAIIDAALHIEPKTKRGTKMRELFAPLGGIELPDVRDRKPHAPIAIE